MVSSKPGFLITIDTEGDNLWECTGPVETRNAAFLPRFQDLCDKFSFKPVYLTDFEMAEDPVFQEFGCDVIARGVGEIGMHLHAWNSPPDYSLSAMQNGGNAYLTEYPPDVMREKIKFMTGLLEDKFDIEIKSHRAGRWGFDETYARILSEMNYLVDCSVTPNVTWAKDPGCTVEGGPDFRGFSSDAYFLNLDDISRSGSSSLLEVPVTIAVNKNGRLIRMVRRTAGMHGLLRIACNAFFPEVTWLRPNGRNLRSMLEIVENSVRQGRDFLMFMIHSSEFMPGGSPYFRTERRVARLYEQVQALFESISSHYSGMTLAEYYKEYKQSSAHGGA